MMLNLGTEAVGRLRQDLGTEPVTLILVSEPGGRQHDRILRHNQSAT